MGFTSKLNAGFSYATGHTKGFIGSTVSCAKGVLNAAASGVAIVTAEAADLLGKTVLIAGTISGSVIAHDVLALKNKTSPIWQELASREISLPLVRYYSKTLHEEMKGTTIAYEAMACIVLTFASPAISLACYKIRDQLKKVQ